MAEKNRITNVDELPAVLQVKDIQAIMGVSKVTAYELANRQGFPAIRLGEKRIVIPKAPFIRWLDEQSAIGARLGA